MNRGFGLLLILLLTSALAACARDSGDRFGHQDKPKAPPVEKK